MSKISQPIGQRACSQKRSNTILTSTKENPLKTHFVSGLSMLSIDKRSASFSRSQASASEKVLQKEERVGF